MKDDNKTKKQLLHELTELRSQDAALKKSITGSISAELAAEEARRYAESIVGTVREPLLVLDVDLKIISANRNFYRTFEVTPGETIGSFIYDLGNKQWNIPKLRELLEEVLPEKQAFDDFEVAHDFQDIGHKIMLLNARQIYRKDIGAKMILLAIEDITERKRVEDTLRESEERFRLAAQSVTDVIWEWNIDQGKLDWHGDIDGLLGYRPDEFPHTIEAWEKIIHPDDHDRVMKALDAHVQQGEPYREEYRIIRKDGSHGVWLDGGIVQKDQTGKTAVMIGAISDITDRRQTEEALWKSEEKFRTIFDRASDGILIADPVTKKFLQGNTAICSMLGYTKEEIESLAIYDIHTTGDISRVLDEFEKQLKGEKVLAEDLPVLRKDGSIFYADIGAAHTTIGGIHYLIGIFRDITERKRAEEALQESEEKYRNLFENANESIFVAQDGKLVFLNPMTAMMIGYSSEELVAKPFIEFIHPDDRDTVIDRHVKRMKGEEFPHRYPFRIIHRDGKFRWVELSAVLIIWKGKAATLNFLSDITDSKLAEAELRESEERYRSLVENANEAIYVAQDGMLKFVNRAGVEIAGYSEQELISKPFIEFIHPDDRAMVGERYLKRLRGEGFESRYAFRFIAKNGGIKWLELGAALINFEGRPATLNLVTDITGRKRAEEELRQTLDSLRKAFGPPFRSWYPLWRPEIPIRPVIKPDLRTLPRSLLPRWAYLRIKSMESGWQVPSMTSGNSPSPRRYCPSPPS